MQVSELMEDTSAQVTSQTYASEWREKKDSDLYQKFSPKRLRLIYTVEAQRDEKYSDHCVVWTIN